MIKIKHTIASFLLIAVASFSVKAQTTPVKQPLDNRVSVQFPAKPQQATVNGSTKYQVSDKDSIVYAAYTADLKVLANLDSAALVPLKDMPEFAEGIKTGLSKSVSAGEIGAVTIGKWKGYSSYSFTGVNAARKNKIYGYIILIGSKVYFLSALVPDGVPAKGKDDYFANVELTK